MIVVDNFSSSAGAILNILFSVSYIRTSGIWIDTFNQAPASHKMQNT